VNRLAGKSAIVTGATEGIGAAIARLFVSEGASVVLVARRRAPGEEMAAELGDGAVFVSGDVSDPATATAAVAAAADLGGPDVLVNNAGLDLSGIELLDTGLEATREVIDVNVVGALLMLQEAARAMRRRGRGGSIVNVTSRTGLIGLPGSVVYGATKGALESLTRGAALELAPLGIRVNNVAPGLTETPLIRRWIEDQDDPEAFRATVTATIPQGRFAEPAEVAAAVLYLASDESSSVTGATLPVDGGYTAG
jgi:NAD(P)-dependent dehydrogenase (short-subunit alcohol dehydrogenase family)